LLNLWASTPTSLIGKHVEKRFRNKHFVGTIIDTDKDADTNEQIWHVKYEDSDSEDYDENELQKYFATISRCSILFYAALQAIWPAVGIFQVGGFTSCTGGSYKFPEWPVRIFQLHPDILRGCWDSPSWRFYKLHGRQFQIS
jgi:hypothetical protein